MRVLTLNTQAFNNECHRLEEIVSSSGFRPELIVAIKTGGLYVAEAMVTDAFKDIEIKSVSISRSLTPLKRLLSVVLRCMPVGLMNVMRKAESVYMRSHRDGSTYAVMLPDCLKGLTGRVLIVDDAVDRGKTLASVVKILREYSPKAEIKSAVITVTQPSPVIMPDFYLYNDSTLIRFPWASDMKTNV